MIDNVTERALWEIIHSLGWWWWGSLALLAAWNLWGIYRLAAVQTSLGRWIRISAIIGFGLVAASPANTAFGPLGLPFIYLAFRGMTYQLWKQCKAEGRIPSTKGEPFSRRVASLIVEQRR